MERRSRDDCEVVGRNLVVNTTTSNEGGGSKHAALIKIVFNENEATCVEQQTAINDCSHIESLLRECSK